LFPLRMWPSNEGVNGAGRIAVRPGG